MYSELLMREHGFDDDARFRVILHTDAIWRACRIILDVRMHRGELTAEEATDFLVQQTGFQRSNAAAEVGWYTYRPTYPLSYLLGRTLLLGLRADEQRRLGDAFSLKGFHDTLLRNGSLPISFHRRALAGEGAVRALSECRSSPRSTSTAAARGRSTGPAPRRASGRPPTGPERIAETFVAMGARADPPRRLRRGARRRPGRDRGDRRRSPSRVAVPIQVAGGRRSADAIRLVFAAGATRVVARHGHRRPARGAAGVPRGGGRLAGGRPGSAARAAGRVSLARTSPPTVETLVGELVGAGVGRFVLSHGGAEPDLERVRSLVRTYDAEILLAGGVRDLDGLRRSRDAGVAGVILGEALLSGAIDVPRSARRGRVTRPRPSPTPRRPPLSDQPGKPTGRPPTSSGSRPPRPRPTGTSKVPPSPPTTEVGGIPWKPLAVIAAVIAVAVIGTLFILRPGSGAAAGRATDAVPDQAAPGHAGRRDPDRDDGHGEGHDRHQARGRPVADRGRQLRRPSSSAGSTTASSSTGRPRSTRTRRS